MAAVVAFCRVHIFLQLLETHALYWSICLNLLHNCRLSLDEHVQELGHRILRDLNHGQLIVLTESRAENGRSGAHFVLLGVICLFCVATKRLEDGLEVCIDHKRLHNAKLVIVEL